MRPEEAATKEATLALEDQSSAEGPVFEMNRVSKRFGGVTAVVDFSIEVYAGELHGLIGPNGAGKTTVVNLATGVFTPDTGTVRLSGASIDNLPTYKRARAGLARTYQQARLFKEMTVAENADLFLKGVDGSHRLSIPDVLSLVGLSSQSGERASVLPHGKAKLLEVACAVLREPPVLLLDEPASGLDSSETRALITLLSEFQRGIGILMIEHNMDLVMEMCERITVMDSGRTLLTGSAEEVRRSPAVVDAYLGGI